MSTVYLLKYNNYYNRIVAREKNLEGYLLQEYLLDRKDDVNFVEDDGVDTTYVCNTETTPDYMVVANGNVIESRWFVIERKILRKGQYKFTLHRDLLVDYYNAIVNAQCFIEKATVLASDPFIFNQEDMTFNQIKTSETLLKDETGCAWVVGYIPKDAFPDGGKVTGDVILDGSADITVEDITKWEYYTYTSPATPYKGELMDAVYEGYADCYVNYGQENKARVVKFGANVNGILYGAILTSSSELQKNHGFYVVNVKTNAQAKIINSTAPKNWGRAANYLHSLQYVKEYLGLPTETDILNFKWLEGKVIYDSTRKVYSQIHLLESDVHGSTEVTSSNIPKLYTWLTDNISRENVLLDGNDMVSLIVAGEPNSNSYELNYRYKTTVISLSPIEQKVSTNMDRPLNRYHLIDQPYDMFCIPYSDTLDIYQNGIKICTANKSIAVNIAVNIAAATGAGNVYDVQLLPYCPVRFCIQSDGKFDVGTARSQAIVDASDKEVGKLIWCTTSSFTFNIAHAIAVGTSGINIKLSNQCDLYRLVSPNYNGQFEFSPAKNGGVTSFNVDCTYKPFSPYIHINPNFGRLYGQDFNDARGLICGGDFSLTQTSNAWANYQLANKNYQLIFDRQIVNLEVSNKIQRTREITGAAFGTLQGGITGGISGAMVGGVGGAIAGAVTGLGASAIGGIADVALADRLRAETLDYTRDMYGYNLGNIQAMPTSIAKTSAFTYNNKLFPILEYYTCTEKEKSAFIEKCNWNGMTVMRIDTIGAFIGNQSDQYIKARLIRITDKSLDDYHMVKAIDDELNRGAFF